MQKTPLELIFGVFDRSSEILQKELACTYLEALVETGENLFYREIVQEGLDDLTKRRLQKIYDEHPFENFSHEDIRKAYQLSILKGMKGHVQSIHQMTPDSIGYLVGYLIEKFLNGKESFSMMDPAVGTGNLLSTILNIHQSREVESFGVEVDELLLKLAFIGANLQKQEIQFFHQDALAPLLIDPVDIVVCDLPVGYYPNDIQANEYELKKEDGHSYSHYLLMEKSIQHTKPGGYLFFLIPNNLFESDESNRLHQYLRKTVHIQGVLQLPLGIFSNEKSAKSIFILQKKQEGIKPPKEVMLAQLPDISNVNSFDRVLIGIEEWFKENKFVKG